MLNPIRDHFDSKLFGVADGLFARLSVSHNAREFERFGDPPAVVFPIDLDRQMHVLIVRQILPDILPRRATAFGLVFRRVLRFGYDGGIARQGTYGPGGVVEVMRWGSQPGKFS